MSDHDEYADYFAGIMATSEQWRSPRATTIDPDSVPKDFPVRPIDPDDPTALEPATCGTCGLTWDDGVSTSWTPAPSGRCPFEYFHRDA